jgi:hypothetical protein
MNRAAAVTLAAVVIALVSALPSAASAATCSGVFQYDSDGYTWDFSSPFDYGMGVIDEGGSSGPGGTPSGVRSGGGDTYDEWGMLFVGGEDAAHAYVQNKNDVCFDEDEGRERVFPKLTLDGLEVQRKVYVSPTGLPGARILNLIHNPGAGPRTTRVQVGNSTDDAVGLFRAGSLGSDDDTRVRSSSEDDGAITAADTWAVTSDHSAPAASTNDDFATAHIFDGAGAPDRIDLATLSEDNLAYRWANVTIPAGGTVAYLSYEVQGGVPDANGAAEDAVAKTAALAYAARPLAHVYEAMTDAEIAAVRNWPRPAPTASIALRRAAVDRLPVELTAADSAASSVAGSCSGIAYAWDLGDGTHADGADVSHRFSAGSHDVAVTVTNSCGESATSRRTIAVKDVTAPTARMRAPRTARVPRIAVQLRSDEAGTASVKLRIGRRTLARASARLRAGTAKRLRLRVNRSGRATLLVTVRDLAGNPVELSRGVRLRR